MPNKKNVPEPIVPQDDFAREVAAREAKRMADWRALANGLRPITFREPQANRFEGIVVGPPPAPEPFILDELPEDPF